MAQRRMFSKTIVVDSDDFLEMPVSSRLLYYDLGMRADDDGFVSPKMVMRITGASEDDLKVLLVKKYVLSFENKVLVIRDWKINNFIRPDRYTPTVYREYLNKLKLAENNQYQLSGIPDVIPVVDPDKVRLGKVRLGKVNKDSNTSEQSSQVNIFIELFKDINPSYARLFANKTQRASCERMLKIHGFEKLKGLVSILPKINQDKYAPVITTPLQLEDKFGQLIAYGQKLQNNQPLFI